MEQDHSSGIVLIPFHAKQALESKTLYAWILLFDEICAVQDQQQRESLLIKYIDENTDAFLAQIRTGVLIAPDANHKNKDQEQKRTPVIQMIQAVGSLLNQGSHQRHLNRVNLSVALADRLLSDHRVHMGSRDQAATVLRWLVWGIGLKHLHRAEGSDLRICIQTQYLQVMSQVSGNLDGLVIAIKKIKSNGKVPAPLRQEMLEAVNKHYESILASYIS